MRLLFSDDENDADMIVTTAQDKLRSQKEIIRLLREGLKKLDSVKIGLYGRRNETIRLQQRYSKELEQVKEDLETAQTVDDGKLRGLNESLEVSCPSCDIAYVPSDTLGGTATERSLRGTISDYACRKADCR